MQCGPLRYADNPLLIGDKDGVGAAVALTRLTKGVLEGVAGWDSTPLTHT